MKNIVFIILFIFNLSYAQNIGIGTETPTSKLEVLGSQSGTVNIITATTLLNDTHWGMALITFALAYLLNGKYWECVLALTLFSFAVGLSIEAYQAQSKKIITNEYIKYSNVDVLVTTVAGFLGALIYYLYI